MAKYGKSIYTVDSVNNCPMNLLRICGVEYESEQLCEKLLRNKVLLLNGGVAFSAENLWHKASLCLSV